MAKQIRSWLGETPAELGRIGGRIGGKSRSKAKTAAARKNGKKGGRPPSWTLAERLLRRKPTTAETRVARNTYNNAYLMLATDRENIQRFFGLDRFYGDIFTVMNTTEWRKRFKRIPPHVQFSIDRFRRSVRYALASRAASQ